MLVLSRWRWQQRPEAKERRGCDTSIKGLSGGHVQWNNQEAISLAQCNLFKVQWVSGIGIGFFIKDLRIE